MKNESKNKTNKLYPKIDAWVSFLQGEISKIENYRLGIFGLILTFYGILIPIAISFFDLLLILYTMGIILSFSIGGIIYLRTLYLRESIIEKLLTEVLRGDYKS